MLSGRNTPPLDGLIERLMASLGFVFCEYPEGKTAPGVAVNRVWLSFHNSHSFSLFFPQLEKGGGNSRVNSRICQLGG